MVLPNFASSRRISASMFTGRPSSGPPYGG